MRWLVFDGEAMAHVDATGLETLVALERGLAREGVTLLLARMHLALERRLEGTGLDEAVPTERRFPTVRAAVDHAVASDAPREAAEDEAS